MTDKEWKLRDSIHWSYESSMRLNGEYAPDCEDCEYQNECSYEGMVLEECPMDGLFVAGERLRRFAQAPKGLDDYEEDVLEGVNDDLLR